MIIETKVLQDSCKKILDAVDTSTSLVVSETLELEVKDRLLFLNVTNKEYYVSVKTPVDFDTDFHAVVEAKKFLSLISKTTTKEVELTTTDKFLTVTANGKYKFPLIYDDRGGMVVLPKISIENVTNEFPIDKSILYSIYKYNSKELQKVGCNLEVQKLFYIDDKGAITFNSGACVNNFTLEQPISIYLTEKLIKLFKLFKADKVSFHLGFDTDIASNVLTKIALHDESTALVAILNSNDSLLKTFPVRQIRQREQDVYSYNVTINKSEVLDAITRLSLFSDDNKASVIASFNEDSLTLYDSFKQNSEVIKFVDYVPELETGYEAKINASDFKLTLETCDEEFINVGFGNHKAIVIRRNNITNILAEAM